MDEQRIKQAHACVKEYLSTNYLTKVSAVDNKIMQRLLLNSLESLRVANKLFEENYSNMWTIVCSYYAMYYVANAVLYKIGYRVGERISHKVTADALIVFVKDKLAESLLESYEDIKDDALDLAGIKAEELVYSFDFERIKRGLIQYRTDEEAKHSKAKTSLDRAKQFVTCLKKLAD
jgi:uncharacterized protein (UPF0332 family)